MDSLNFLNRSRMGCLTGIEEAALFAGGTAATDAAVVAGESALIGTAGEAALYGAATDASAGLAAAGLGAGVAAGAGMSAGEQFALQMGGQALLGGLLKPSGIKAPTNRSYLGEMNDALYAQGNIQNKLLGLQNEYVPMYQQMQQQALLAQMGNVNAQYQAAMPMAQQLSQQYAQGAGASYNTVGQTAQNAYNATMNPAMAGLQTSMANTVQEQLNAGTGLTAAQTQQAQQSARAAASARGLSGNQAIAQEVLNSYNLGNQRQQQALANANTVYGTGMQYANNAMNAYGTPLMAQMNMINPSGLIATAGSQNASLNQNLLFQPESSYNAGIYGANQSNQMQTQLGNLQANAGWSSGMMSMMGNLGGAYLKNSNVIH